MCSVSSKAMAESTLLTGPRPVVPPGPTPVSLDKHFDFLEWCPAGDVLLVGTSDLTSRTWAGSIWLFAREESISAENVDGWKPQQDRCLVGAGMDTGVTVGRFLRSSDQIVVGCDSGAIQIISAKKCSLSASNESSNSLKFEGQGSISEHSDVVLDIDDLGGDGLNFVSCSQDKSVKVWDLECLLSSHTFAPAHGHIVTSVRGCPVQPKVFASCALDGSALLWDTRDEIPASTLADPSGIGLTSVSWIDENSVVLGSVGGQLSIVDTRNTTLEKVKLQLERRPIHLMRSAPSLPGVIAVCQDNSRVSVLEFVSDALETIFSNDSHGDMVRGLAWDPKKLSLWSCGWDSKILCHQVHHNGSN